MRCALRRSAGQLAHRPTICTRTCASIEAYLARAQIIREHLKRCEEADGEAGIPPEHFDADGELDNAHIRCSACTKQDSSDDNDILLCDGELCTRAYHVGCLPVKAGFDPEALPQEIGWLCPACDCRYDILWNLAETFELDYDELIPCRCALHLSAVF
jgi:PHD-finger